jgi:hypothetical protein
LQLICGRKRYGTENVCFPCGSTAQFWAMAASMKLSVSFRLLDLGQSAGLLGRVISSSQGLCLCAPGDDREVGGMSGFGRETEVLGENLTRRHFVHHKSHFPDPGRRGGKPATNRFSYGAASREWFRISLESLNRANSVCVLSVRT